MKILNLKFRSGRIMLLIAMIIMAISCSVAEKKKIPEVKTSRLGDDGRVADGAVVYALPRTVLNIKIGFNRTVEKPGPYQRYAGELLGIKDVIQKEKESWDLVSVDIEQETEADPSELYVIESNTDFTSNVLSLVKSGLIIDINPEAEKDKNPGGLQRITGHGSVVFSDLGANEYFLSQSDTAFRVVKLDTTFVKIPYLVEKKKQLSTDQLAEKAAKTVLDIREGKLMLLTGETNVYPQDPSGINELNRMEQEYTALFTGKRVSEKYIYATAIIPGNNPQDIRIPLPVRNLSSQSNAQVSDEITVSFKTASKLKDITYVSPSQSITDNVAEPGKLYYRMPENVTVSVTGSSKKYYEGRFLIYQFGQIIQLPSGFILKR